MKMKCSNPCKDKKTCKHYGVHEDRYDCREACYNGAKCVPASRKQKKSMPDVASYLDDGWLEELKRVSEECVLPPTTIAKEDCADNIVNITKERGANYGHPLHHFPLTRALSGKWIEARRAAVLRGSTLQDEDREMALAHAVYMICDKLARAVTNPMHKDNWDDIAGYSRTAKMALGLEQ